MTPQEMLDHCRQQVKVQGAAGRVVFWLPGRAPASGTKRLFGRHGGPVGEVLSENEGKCLCMFEAAAVMDALSSLLQEVSND